MGSRNRKIRRRAPHSLIHHGIAVAQAAMLLLRSQAAEELTHAHGGDALQRFGGSALQVLEYLRGR